MVHALRGAWGQLGEADSTQVNMCYHIAWDAVRKIKPQRRDTGTHGLRRPSRQDSCSQEEAPSMRDGRVGYVRKDEIPSRRRRGGARQGGASQGGGLLCRESSLPRNAGFTDSTPPGPQQWDISLGGHSLTPSPSSLLSSPLFSTLPSPVSPSPLPFFPFSLFPPLPSPTGLYGVVESLSKGPLRDRKRGVRLQGDFQSGLKAGVGVQRRGETGLSRGRDPEGMGVSSIHGTETESSRETEGVKYPP
jgi:hypothetical protein